MQRPTGFIAQDENALLFQKRRKQITRAPDQAIANENVIAALTKLNANSCGVYEGCGVNVSRASIIAVTVFECGPSTLGTVISASSYIGRRC